MAGHIGQEAHGSALGKLLLPRAARVGGRCTRRDLGRRIQFAAGTAGCVLGTATAFTAIVLLPAGSLPPVAWVAIWLSAMVGIAGFLTPPLYRSARRSLTPSRPAYRGAAEAYDGRWRLPGLALFNYFAAAALWIGGVLMLQAWLPSIAGALADLGGLFYPALIAAYLPVYVLLLMVVQRIAAAQD